MSTTQTPTRREQMLALIKSRPGIGTCEICAALGINKSHARNLRQSLGPLIKNVHSGRATIYFSSDWAGEYAAEEEDDSAEIEIPRTPADTIIKKALASRTPLELTWRPA